MSIRIMTGGSMGANKYQFSDTEGNAMAVAKAIQFLSTELFPMAVKRDHELHAQGVSPEKGYAGFMLPVAEEEEAPEKVAQRAAENASLNVDDDLEEQRDSLVRGQHQDVQDVMAQLEAADE